MVYREGADVTTQTDSLFFDSNYILWHPTDDISVSGIMEKDGKLWCPQRRI